MRVMLPDFRLQILDAHLATHPPADPEQDGFVEAELGTVYTAGAWEFAIDPKTGKFIAHSFVEIAFLSRSPRYTHHTIRTGGSDALLPLSSGTFGRF